MTERKVSGHIRSRVRESFLFLIIPLAVYVLISLISYHPQDSGPFSASNSDVIHNYGGSNGAVIADILLNIIGYLSYLIPIGLVFVGWNIYQNNKISTENSWFDTLIKAGGFVSALLSGCALAYMYIDTKEAIFTGGGIVGEVVGKTLFTSLGTVGATLILCAIFLAGTEQTPVKRFDLMHNVNARGTFLVTQACLPLLHKATNPHVLMLSPPLNMDAKWFTPHVAYTMAKYGMSMCVLGMSEEFRSDGIAVNALWPQTAIATAAVQNLLGGDEAMRRCRTDQIVADAAHSILIRPSRECTGNFFVDEDVLRKDGVTNFDQYRISTDGELLADFFLD